MNRRELLTGGAVTVAGLAVPQSMGNDDWYAGSKAADTAFPFSTHQIKFSLDDMMRDIENHEGRMLAAYPDPEGKVALIGAGFNLGVMKEITRDADSDPYRFNGHARKEPSSEALWQMAGLHSSKLHEIQKRMEGHLEADQQARPSVASRILRRFSRRLAEEFSADITNTQSRALLYVSSRQATYNAMAYSSDFANLTQSQQMGMSELVFQMGSNLEKFEKFLGKLNDPPVPSATPEEVRQHWRDVQSELVDSAWFKTYHKRAVRVTAMMDPNYDFYNPAIAEAKVKELENSMTPHADALGDKASAPGQSPTR